MKGADMKRFTALLLVLALCFCLCVECFASTKYTATTSYSKYCTCTLSNKNDCGYVRVNVYNTNYRQKGANYNDVVFKTTKGAYIWGEYGAIDWCGGRTFYLGNDHSAYRIYVRTNYGKASVTFANYGNLKLS